MRKGSTTVPGLSKGQDIIVRWHKSQAILSLVMSGAMAMFFAAMTAYSAPQSGEWAVGVAGFCAAFMLLFAALAWWSWRWGTGDRIAAVIGESGIRQMLPAGRHVALAWSQVGGLVLAEASRLRRTPRMLLVVPADPAAFLAGLSRPHRLLRRCS